MIIEGNFVLKHLNAPNSTIPGIFMKGNLAAISRKAGGYITIPTGNYAGTYLTSNDVFKNEMIAPMGGSGGIGSFPSNDPFDVHLHLYKFDSNPGDHINHSNCTDASRELSLNENTTYSLNTSTINNNSGISINYGLQNNYPRSTSLKTRIDMNGAIPNGERFSNVFMKIITVDYRLTSELLVAQRIKGPYYYGYFNLDGIYPIKITNDHWSGNWNRTGIYPYAYSGQSYDDYFFSDFNPRIHKNDAGGNLSGNGTRISNPIKYSDTPIKSRYNDGNYSLNILSTDTHYNVFGELKSFTLDNFQPFLTNIELQQFGAFPFFGIKRNQGEGTTGINDGYVQINNSEGTYLQGIEFNVKVESSEPLSYLTGRYRVVGTNSWINLGSFKKSISNPLSWESKKISNFLYQECYEFEFKGTDKSGNSLINISKMTNNNTIQEYASIPVRTGVGQWDNIDPDFESGADYIVYCPTLFCSGLNDIRIPRQILNQSRDFSGDCNELNTFHEELIYHCDDGTYEIVLPNLEGFSYAWKEINDEEYVEGENSYIINSPGTYCYLAINLGDENENCCVKEECIEITENDFDDFQIPISYNIVAGSNETLRNLELLYNGDFSDLNYPITIELENTSGSQSFVTQVLSPATSLIPFVGLIAGQSYCLTYTDVNECSVENCFEIEGNSCNDNYFTISGEITNATCNNNNGSIEIYAVPSSSNGCQNFTYKWNDPLNSTSSTISNLPPGTYCVTVSFIDSQCLGCSSSQCFTVEGTTGDPIEVNAITRIICYEEYKDGNYNNYTIKWKGYVDMTISGGTGDYAFNWYPNPVNSGNNQNGGVNSYRFEFDQNGPYCVEITDDCGNIYQNCFDDAPIVRKSTDGISLEAAEKIACLGVGREMAEGFYRSFGFSDPKFNIVDLMSQLAQRNYPASLAYSPDLIFVKDHFTADSVSYNMLIDNKFIMGNVGFNLRSGLREVSSVENNDPKVIAEDNGLILQAYPNPFSDLLNISVFSKENMHGVLEVYDIMGQKIYSENITVSKDNTISRSLPLNSISSGIYTISLLTDESYQNIKVVKVK
jgi:hypothetical protein